MKKIFLSFMFVIIVVQPGFCIFGIEKIKADFNLLKNETTNNIEKQHNEYSALKMENADALAKITADFNLKIGNINTKITGLDMNIDKSNKTNTAQTGNNNSNNDSNMITSIFKGLFALMSSICLWLIKSNMTKDKQISNLIDRNTAKELKIYEMNDKHTASLLAMISTELLEDNVKIVPK